MTTLARCLGAAGPRKAILSPWAERLFSSVGTLKFIPYIGEDGYPAIIPVVPCQASGGGKLVFAPAAHRRELAALRAGATLAVFAVNLQMESVLVRGCFTGYGRYMGLKAGAIDIDWVYNSMPPMQGTIYPVEPVRAVADHQRWV